MPFCSFSDGAAMFDVTPIENMFLLEYLPTAPDGFLRVYLYARMLCLHPELGGEIADMAKALRMDESAVFDAFSYWERQGLVERLSDRPPTYAIRPLKGAAEAEMDRDYYKYREFNASMQDLFGAQLLHPGQYEMAADWLNLLGLSQEAVLKLLEYELQQGGKQPAAVFKRANRRAAEWAEQGIKSLEDVERAILYDDHVHSIARLVLKQLSIARKASINELDCVRRWVGEWKLGREEILDACALTTKSRNPSIAYLDAILRARVESGGGDMKFEDLKHVLRELNAANKIPAPAQLETYSRWLEQGFENETILLAAKRCAGKNWHSFDRLEEMLGEWAEKGAFSHAQAENYLAGRKQLYLEMKQLMQQAGLSRSPSNDDVGRYELWKNSYDPSLMAYAAQCANGKARPIPYMEKLLSEWAKKGVSTVEDAKAEHAQAAQQPKNQGSPVNFQQRSYTKEETEKDYFDLEKFFAEEENKA